MIELEGINRFEAVRYLGGSKVQMNSAMEALLDECEAELSAAAVPRYLYKKVNLSESGLVRGKSAGEHLAGCEYAVLMCATLGADVDRLIRTAQVKDMSRAVVLDALASAAVEQICNKLEAQICAENAEKHATWRFSPGYGDYPIELQKDFLQLLDAPRKIGLCTNDSYLLTPTKSVTAIIGLSDAEIERKRRGCAGCNMAKTCKFRKAGIRCEF